MRANVNWRLDGVLDGNKHRKLSLPLPSEVDVADLAFLPLFDRHLMKSRAWLQAKNWRGEGPGLAFCIMNLWIGAFRAVPAGSLEDDNSTLADVANVSIEHWKTMRTQALRGWIRIGRRLWHPAVSQIAWSLWMARVQSRHFKAQDASRSSTKRALEKGVEPPSLTPPYDEWIVSEYPETHAYIAGQTDQTRSATLQLSPLDTRESPLEKRAKLSKANYSPHTPLLEPSNIQIVRPNADWFSVELRRLKAEFGPMVDVMTTYLQRPGVIGDFGLVRSFKGCWLEKGNNASGTIVACSARQAATIVKDHGEWLFSYWPNLTVRHATKAELNGVRRREE